MIRITIADPEKHKYYRMAVTPTWAERHNNGALISCGLTIGRDGFTRRHFQLAQYRFSHVELTQEEYNHSGCQSYCILRGHDHCQW
jgi:hypothetical protein